MEGRKTGITFGSDESERGFEGDESVGDERMFHNVAKLVAGLFTNGESASQDEKMTFLLLTGSSVTALVWSVLFFSMGLQRSGYVTFSYCLLSAVNVKMIRPFSCHVFMLSQSVLLLFVPICVHVFAGGLIPSRGVLMWSFLAVVFEVTRVETSPNYVYLVLWASSAILVCCFWDFPFAKDPEISPTFMWCANVLVPCFVAVILVGLLNAQVQRERKRFQSLLFNMLPRGIAVRMLRQPAVTHIAHHFAHASVMFIDLVDFTVWAQQVTPTRLISTLNSLFSIYDGIAAKHGIEKIKTIGDCFLGVAGVPDEIDVDVGAQKICQCALECVAAVADFNNLLDSHLRVRVGISTGPLIAGVIGRSRIQYDVWGESVNLAARIETTGVAGRVSICETTYKLVKQYFVCEYRGEIELKGVGPTKVYFVE